MSYAGEEVCRSPVDLSVIGRVPGQHHHLGAPAALGMQQSMTSLLPYVEHESPSLGKAVKQEPDTNSIGLISGSSGCEFGQFEMLVVAVGTLGQLTIAA